MFEWGQNRDRRDGDDLDRETKTNEGTAD